MGDRQLSLKGPDGVWRGRTTLSVADRGARGFIRLENGYVSQDGQEIRQWPGSFTLLDLSEENNPIYGYARYITDVVLPIFSTTPTETYQFEQVVPYTIKQTLNSRAKPQHLHCFKQVQDQIVVIGESRFRESPLYNSSRVPLTVLAIDDSAGKIRLTLSGNTSSHTADDNAAAALNGITQYQVVYCENVQLDEADPVLQAVIDAKLNRRVHPISSISGDQIILQTAQIPIGSLAMGCTGEIHVVRFNRANTYDNTNGLSPYNGDPLLRIDDPTSLTSWRVIDQPAKGDSVRECFPAWVANRQRDLGDAREAAAPTEGVWQDVFGRRGVSRRECLELPYRVNPEAATDRVILAAPGYGCMFQVPVKIPADPAGELGVTFFANDLHDRPRSLGIPKARAVECIYKTPPASLAENGTLGRDFNVRAIASSASNGLPAGTYKFAITYEDDAIGEEGLASETVEVTIPSNGNAYTIQVALVHPGYIMGECLATKFNIYLALPGQDDLAFYMSSPLAQRPLSLSTVNGTNGDLSAKYGIDLTSSVPTIFRTFAMPLPGSTNDLSGYLDPSRLAPQSAAMPRGADAARYVRGVLLSGGHIGNTGGSLQLWASKASGHYGFDSFQQNDQILIRAHGDTLDAPSANMDGDIETHALGVAGRCFPSAYQGIDMIQRDMLPGRVRHQIDRVLNRMGEIFSYGSPLQKQLHYERLRLTRPVWDQTRDAGTTPDSVDIARSNRDIWYVEPRGQLQVADPGAPNRSSPLFIKLIDPNKGDDITAIGDLGGRGIVCSRNETYSFEWLRNPGSEEPRNLSNLFGCVAANSMVQFDGGLAWMSARGPVAIGGAGVQHVGVEIESDFQGRERRYEYDSRGMMRHCWGVHDEQRGLVIWGMVTRGATQRLEREFVSYTFATASDELRSRFPCDELVVWSYRTNSFSTVRMPAGREILWMEPIRDANGHVWMAYLAADGRIYGLDDTSHDTSHGEVEIEVAMTTRGSNTTTIEIPIECGQDGDTTTGRDGDAAFVRTGMMVEVSDQNGELISTTSIDSITSTGASLVCELADAVSWDSGYTVRIGARPRMTLVSTYLGAEAKTNLNISDVQIRYTLFGQGTAHFSASMLTTKQNAGQANAEETQIAGEGSWLPMGEAQAQQSADGYRVARRRNTGRGGSASPETSVKMVFTGSAQVRLADIALEVS